MDKYRSTIGVPKNDLEWSRIVDTFCLKYPTVLVIRRMYGQGEIPRAFLVWRQKNGDYEVELQRSIKEVRERIAFQRSIDRSLEGWNGSTMLRNALEEVRYAGQGGLISWGKFDYSCRAGVGEFCADDLGIGHPFSYFVLREEQRRFVMRL